MNKLVLLCVALHFLLMVNAQTPTDTIIHVPAPASLDTLVSVQDSLPAPPPSGAADDPTQFLTRIEFFNNLKHFDNEVYFNMTTIRTILQFRNRFTTRLDIPLVYHSMSSDAGYAAYGLGDISVRMLGFRLFKNPKSTLTTSIELSFNTATSPYFGTGKNLIIPMLSYSTAIKKDRGIFSLSFQQTNSMWGDKERETVNFSKVQAYLLTFWSKRFWTILSPEMFIDYVHTGVSMNLLCRLGIAPVPLINIWVQAGTGLFGDFIDRYQWNTEVGFRYLLFRKKLLQERHSR